MTEQNLNQKFFSLLEFEASTLFNYTFGFLLVEVNMGCSILQEKPWLKKIKEARWIAH